MARKNNWHKKKNIEKSSVATFDVKQLITCTKQKRIKNRKTRKKKSCIIRKN